MPFAARSLSSDQADGMDAVRGGRIDPTVTYQAMKQAMLDSDYEAAREYASNLKRWLGQGGSTRPNLAATPST